MEGVWHFVPFVVVRMAVCVLPPGNEEFVLFVEFKKSSTMETTAFADSLLLIGDVSAISLFVDTCWRMCRLPVKEKGKEIDEQRPTAKNEPNEKKLGKNSQESLASEKENCRLVKV